MADTNSFGADVNRKQFSRLIIGTCAGTLIEWYDYSVFTQLSATITREFFPARNHQTAEFGYWGVIAIGFVARPIGSILFGHLGDTRGRRTTMLLSILCVSVPTILIGALPTYEQAGVAAPVLMAIMRLVQGLAVGGEYGSALAYMYELAPHHLKGTVASLGVAAVAPGNILALLVIMAVTYACSPAQLALWGWRVPFLLAALTTPIALLLRMHMPEPYEYLASREALMQQRAAELTAKAVNTHACDNEATGASDHLPAVGSGGVDDPQQQTRHTAMKLDSANTEIQHGHAALLPQVPLDSTEAVTRGLLRTASASSFRQQQAIMDHSTDQQPSDASATIIEVAHKSTSVDKPCLPAAIKHHIPLLVIARDHWRQLLLLFLLEIFPGAVFYFFLSWVPAYLRSPAVGVPERETLIPILLGMVLFGAAIPLSGRMICDRRIPKLWSLLVIYVALAAGCPPAILWATSGSVVAFWVVVLLAFTVAGVSGAVFASVCVHIYPSGVRITGYNLSHNLAMVVAGGVSPLAVVALETALPSVSLAAVVVLLSTAGVSLIALLLLMRLAPHLNRCATMGELLTDTRVI